MPRYYCDYCDTYLTHDSPSVRKQHNAGYKHKGNVRAYYQKFEEEQTQTLIDQRIKQHLGQNPAFQQVGAAYNKHLASFPGQRPYLPMISPPVLPLPTASSSQMAPGVMPPVLPRPFSGAPGYGTVPGMAPNAGQGPFAPSMPMQANLSMLNAAPPAPSSNDASSGVMQAMYQANPSGGAAPANSTAGSYSQQHAPEASH
ncbi:unnamed protein product [Ilex paraguariensis]|uniref:U1 small nuclear ribonucleoprotein C n=1 Tax=Ilex paraguariensis TaxID=185542 RepID=A0ABC8RKK0_9AQUA